jgi:MoaA/NifB/PqqE/SkfB family radical SAM enzyme
MDIEPTTGCNFRCTMCQVSSPDFKAENMKLELFKKLIDDNPQ